MLETNDSETIGQASVANTAVTTIAVDAEVALSPLPDNDNTKGTSERQNETNTSLPIVYNPKKPKWWNRLGNNGRDATKSQKRAMRKVLDGTTTATDSSTTTTPGLRLPQIPYGSKLDWDEIFPNSSEDNRNIWLELGFGRGENLQALLESKLWKEEKFQNNSNHGKNNGYIGDDNTANEPSPCQKEPRNFYLVGAEVSGIGIGCLCKRIDQLQQEQENNNNCDDHYVLYRPEMDQYSSEGNKIATADNKCGETSDATNDSQIPRIEQRASLAKSYSDRFRIHTGDGYKLLPKLPNGSLSAILVTFPDPFPKKSDVNYRLVQHQTLIECHRILRKGRPSGKNNDSENDATDDNNNDSCDWNGRLFLATDHDGYHEWCHKIIHEVNNNNNNQDDPSSSSQALFKIEAPCPNRMDWLPAISRYEQKGWDEGRSTKLSCWVAI